MPRKPAAEVTHARLLRNGLTLQDLLDGRRPGGRHARALSLMQLYKAGGPQPAQMSRVMHKGAALSEEMLDALCEVLGVSNEVGRVAYSLARRAAGAAPKA